MNEQEIAALEVAVEALAELAKACGLDFYPMRFEICPADVIYTFGAYGMPTRFTHWSFGKTFHRMKLEYDYNLSRIYELVINSDPCYAFLLEGNSLLQNKLIAAHVLAHSDFFKNNRRFRHTSRFMVESMAVHATRIQEYESKYGRERVEAVLDAALALQWHVEQRPLPKEEPEPKVKVPKTPYDDLWQLDNPPTTRQVTPAKRRTAAVPDSDLLRFLLQHGRYLEDWERDILDLIRHEALYFRPQMETKIMNEGWATFWHLRLMRSLDLTESETIEFARMHANVIAPSRTHLNPYLVGLKVFEDIEQRWDRDKIFEVREVETDVSFLRNFLTKDLIEALDLYIYRRVGNEWKVVETEWQTVRDTLAASLTNSGIPVIEAVDHDYRLNGELLLRHAYEGDELDVHHLERTLPYVRRLWGRNVHLKTVIDGSPVTFSCDGEQTKRT